jgi:hypothetical protein
MKHIKEMGMWRLELVLQEYVRKLMALALVPIEALPACLHGLSD